MQPETQVSGQLEKGLSKVDARPSVVQLRTWGKGLEFASAEQDTCVIQIDRDICSKRLEVVIRLRSYRGCTRRVITVGEPASELIDDLRAVRQLLFPGVDGEFISAVDEAIRRIGVL